MQPKDTERIKMYVNIGEERISLKVAFDNQDDVRDTEAHIRNLYSKWRKEFPQKTGAELLAMLAYQYASFYLEMTKREKDAAETLEELDKRLDKMLSKI